MTGNAPSAQCNSSQPHIRATEDPLGRQSSARRPLQARRFGCIAIRALGCGHWPTHGRQGRKCQISVVSRVFAPPSARHAPPRHAARCTHPPVPPRAVGPINFMVLDFSNVLFSFKKCSKILEFSKFFSVFYLFFSPAFSPARAHRSGQKARTAPTRLLQKRTVLYACLFLTSVVLFLILADSCWTHAKSGFLHAK